MLGSGKVGWGAGGCLLVPKLVWKVNVGGSGPQGGAGEGPEKRGWGKLDIAASSEVSFTLLLPALCGRGDLFCLLEDAVDM